MKRLKKLTPEEFIRKSLYIFKRLETLRATSAKRVQELNDEYVARYTSFKIGQVIDLPEGTKENYTKFLVEKITPQIKATSNMGEFQITIELHGKYQNNTAGDELKGILKIQAPGKEEMSKA